MFHPKHVFLILKYELQTYYVISKSYIWYDEWSKQDGVHIDWKLSELSVRKQNLNNILCNNCTRPIMNGSCHIK